MNVLERIIRSHPIQRLDPRRRGRVGFATGAIVAILTSAGTLTAIHLTNAEPFPSNSASGTSASASQSTNSMQSPTYTDKNPGAVTDKTATVPKPAPSTAAPTPSATSNKYAALGDSVAAGLGLPPVANATQRDRTCGRSSQAYAFQVGQQLGYGSTTLLACSGATAGDLLTRQSISGTNPSAQLTAAYAGGTPTLITITAGANDSRWQTFVKKCYTTTCGSNSDTTITNAALALTKAKLTAAMQSIQLRANASNTRPPTVILTGYYNPFSGQCLNSSLNNGRISQAELDWLNRSINSLNAVIKDTADSYGFARFAAVDFSGHDLCSADPWIQGLNDAAPVHPTAEGQQAIAQSIINAAR